MINDLLKIQIDTLSAKLKHLFCSFSLLLFCPFWLAPGLLADQNSVTADLFPTNNFVKIEGGCYQMGDLFGDGGSDEKPVHEVCLSDFYISKYETTQKQWTAIMGNNPSFSQDNPDYPVDVVSWYEVESFLENLNRVSSGTYRLPTEAEWEYACRSGGKKLKYGTQNGAYGKKLLTVSEESRDQNGIKPVGSFPPNALGLYDMSGNVSEWVADYYDQHYYEVSPIQNPKGPKMLSNSLTVRRGGFWGDRSWIQRCSFRNWRTPNFRLRGLGFRLIWDPQ